MNLHSLSNTQLIICFESLVRSERKITAQVLECIAEVDRRKLYEEKGYTSLFDFLVGDHGYSPGAAMRRVDGARLLREIPETVKKFQAGTLTLSQANQIQRAARELKKMKNETLSTENKRELLLQIENTTQKQTEQILATTLDLPIIPVQKETLHRDQSVTLTITFTQEQMQILEQAQSMISHSLTSQDWAEAITHLAKREVARRTNVRKTPANIQLESAVDKKDLTTPVSVTAVAAVKSPTPKRKRLAIPAAIRKPLLHVNAVCAHKDASGMKCESKKFLQIDHIQSWSRGGANDAENLQVLCGVHNRYKHVKESNF